MRQHIKTGVGMHIYIDFNGNMSTACTETNRVEQDSHLINLILACTQPVYIIYQWYGAGQLELTNTDTAII